MKVQFYASRCDLITEQKSFKQSLLIKQFVANIGLSQLNWTTVPQLGACSDKTSVIIKIIVTITVVLSAGGKQFHLQGGPKSEPQMLYT